MVNVNTVYRTVLYILNKEQRGYLTPAEFNKLANQVQLEIFEKYFDEMNMVLRMPVNNSEYADREKNLDEKISVFEKDGSCSSTTPPNYSFPVDLHRIGSISYNGKSLERVSHSEYNLIQKSPFTKPTTSFPVYILKGTFDSTIAPLAMDVYPTTINTKLPIHYIKKPSEPIWAYKKNAQGGFIYQEAASATAVPATGSVQFELHPTEQTNIILNILMYAGVIIRDPQIVQNAAQMIAQDEAVEKS